MKALFRTTLVIFVTCVSFTTAETVLKRWVCSSPESLYTDKQCETLGDVQGCYYRDNFNQFHSCAGICNNVKHGSIQDEPRCNEFCRGYLGQYGDCKLVEDTGEASTLSTETTVGSTVAGSKIPNPPSAESLNWLYGLAAVIILLFIVARGIACWKRNSLHTWLTKQNCASCTCKGCGDVETGTDPPPETHPLQPVYNSEPPEEDQRRLQRGENPELYGRDEIDASAGPLDENHGDDNPDNSRAIHQEEGGPNVAASNMSLACSEPAAGDSGATGGDDSSQECEHLTVELTIPLRPNRGD